MLKYLTKGFVLSLVSLVWLSAACRADAPAASPQQETKEQRDARMAWFRDARFGMFIHWGLYSEPAGEWNGEQSEKNAEWLMEYKKIPMSDYVKLRDRFNPVKFDAKQWVAMAKNAGVKYIVLTSKHHDGFSMFDSKLSDWDIMATPFRRDPTKELAEACKEAGITFCVYHSIMDWYHPDYAPRREWNDVAQGEPNMDRYVENFLKGQLKELATNYGPLGILWFDGEWEDTWTHERGKDLYNYVRSLQPDIIINNRVGKNRQGMQGMSKGPEIIGDYGTPEQQIPPNGFPGVDWETCMTMNDTWGYNKGDDHWKPASEMIRMLIDCASKGGNMLLNVGPTAEGVIPEPSVERLAAIGKWMQVNSESIYGTTASPFPKALPWGRVTQKPGKLYLHVFDWPKDGKLTLPAQSGKKAASAYLLADPEHKPLAVCTNDKGVEVSLPAEAPDPVASVIVLNVE